MQHKTIKIVILVVVGILLFYAGTQYAKSQTTATSATTASAYAARAGRTGATTGAFGGGTAGTVVSVDPQSITLSLKAGGSIIVFYGTTTPITMTTSGTISDVQVGSNLTVAGTANSDGSISAQSIRIEPSMPAAPATATQ